jgi:hypothetical protein
MILTSALNLVVITLERYFKVVHPLIHRASFSRWKATLSIGLVWTIGIGYNLLVNLPTSAVVDGQCMMQVFWPSQVAMADNVVHFSLQYLIPINVFVYCYTKMALVLYRGSISVTAPQNGGPKADTKTMSTSSKRALYNIVKTMILVSVAFFICFSPNQWLFFLYRFNLFDWRIFYNPIYNISVIAMYLNCCINPAIYAASYKQFQSAVRQLLCRKANAVADAETAVFDRQIAVVGLSAQRSVTQHRATRQSSAISTSR